MNKALLKGSGQAHRYCRALAIRITLAARVQKGLILVHAAELLLHRFKSWSAVWSRKPALHDHNAAVLRALVGSGYDSHHC